MKSKLLEDAVVIFTETVTTPINFESNLQKHLNNTLLFDTKVFGIYIKDKIVTGSILFEEDKENKVSNFSIYIQDENSN